MFNICKVDGVLANPILDTIIILSRYSECKENTPVFTGVFLYGLCVTFGVGVTSFSSITPSPALPSSI